MKPALLPPGEVPCRSDPNIERWQCNRCGGISKRARKERDGLCLACAEEIADQGEP